MTLATEDLKKARSVAQKIRVALIGNPNTGKTTLFNALTGHRAHVGNYSGVTVEKREGPLRRNGSKSVSIVDLPGSYSLSAHSPDELVAVRVLLGDMDKEPRPDVAVVVADASNLERNLFLATQVLELGVPTIIALNMMDLAKSNGVSIDVEKLSKVLGVPVVPVVARSQQGLDKLAELMQEPEKLPVPAPAPVYPEDFLTERDRLRGRLKELGVPDRLLQHFLVKRPLVEVNGMIEQEMIKSGGEGVRRAISESRDALTEKGLRLRSLEASCRYRWIRRECGPAIQEKKPAGRTSKEVTDKIDAVLTHKVWGTTIFLVLMAIVFQAIYAWSAPLMDLIDGFFAGLGGLVAGVIPAGPVQSFLVDGVIAGVGGVLVFLPQICVLFLFIALLEDVGYMARAAFLMDRLLSRVGLSGRSFIPMLSSFACAIPGIMAARTIDDRRDRMATILVAPLMSCSARLPVYTIFIAAFIPERSLLWFFNVQGIVLLAMYLVGAVVAIPVTFILKKTLLKAKTPSFLIELPSYRWPLLKNVFYRMYERAREFVIRAGTIILAVSIVIWALTYYPRPDTIEEEHGHRVEYINDVYTGKLADADFNVSAIPAPGSGEDLAAFLDEGGLSLNEEQAGIMDAWVFKLYALETQANGAYLRQSYLARAGKFVEPVVKPLGWDWRVGMAVIASFPAREVIVATLGVIFDLGGDADEDNKGLIGKVRGAKWPDGRPLFNIPVAVGLMVFFALCMQCAATLAIMKRETNSWRWPVFSFVYMTGLAYFGALIVYQGLSLVM